jgi:beta-galactosidase
MRKIICFFLFSLFFLSATNAQNLYVGVNYHPHDNKNPRVWEKEIKMMKDAGFKVVRMGHLAWDSFEPTEGQFDFKWFDKVMDMMNDAGIKVVLDLAVRPAPIWLHHKYPSIDVTNADGHQLYANSRYMEDVGDSMYQKYALAFTEKMVKRYSHHPALIAFGIDNESGDGPISYSENVRKRFSKWLKAKYVTTENLNKAWANQRWSRHINDFDEVGLPDLDNKLGGSPEKKIDFHYFVSDEIVNFLTKVIDRVRVIAPHILTNTNSWYWSTKYFDYARLSYAGLMDRGGMGVYPGNSLTHNQPLMDSMFGITRIEMEQKTPFWCTEFTTMTAAPGFMRKCAYTSLLFGNQMVCGWTWQSMHNGEEQYLQGLTDWDGLPNRKYDEYKKIATEFAKIQKYFPYRLKDDIGLAFSFPSQMASLGRSAYESHESQLTKCFHALFYRNKDTHVLDLRYSKMPYKLLIIAGHIVMDSIEANNVRKFVSNGGTVIMTANSAVTNVHGRVYDCTHPALLNDVFGIRVSGFELTSVMNELTNNKIGENDITINFYDKKITTSSGRFDVIHPQGCDVLSTITSMNEHYPIITSHRYGKGQAIYVGLPASESWLNPVLDKVLDSLDIKGPDVPFGVLARKIDDTHYLYMNVSNERKEIKLSGKAQSLINNTFYDQKVTIEANEPEFVELKK